MSKLNEFLNTYGQSLRSKVTKAFSPIYDPLREENRENEWRKKLENLLRQPFPKQTEAVLALTKGFSDISSGLYLVAEMGSGKTAISLFTSYLVCKEKSRTLIMCPGHLVEKWAREVRETIPNAIIVDMNKPGLEDVMSLKGNPKPKGREFWIIGKERAKNHYTRKPAFNIRMGRYACPECGFFLAREPNVKGGKPVCPNKSCSAPLWQASNERLIRFAKSEYVKRYLNRYVFSMFICDELHQYKAGNSAQGQAYANFVKRSKYTLNLTGTLIGGYATHLFYLLYRLIPGRMKEICDYNSAMAFAERFGVVERIEKETLTAKDASIGRSNVTTRVVERPGISPMIFTDLLLQRCVFMKLEDVSNELPAYTEHVIEIEMSEAQRKAYSTFEYNLVSAVRQSLAAGDKSLLGAMVNSLLAYPDGARKGETVVHPRKIDPDTGEPLIVAEAPALQEEMLPKEQRLIECVQKEKNENRKVMICLEHTGTRDLIPDIQSRLENAGFSVLVLRQSTVSADKREGWLKSKMKARDYDVLVTNPRLIETGLDLLDFPTIIYFQTGYSTFTLRQSSRRSWRIGQTKDVRVYYMTYLETMQATALALIADKLQVALAVEGDLSDAGLTAIADGDASMLVKMAKTLIGEEKPPEAPIGELFGQLGEKSIQNDGRLDELEHPVARMETTFITLTGKDGQRRMIVVEKVKRGVIRHSPGGHEAVAVIDHSNAQFKLSAGKVIYKGKQIGKYEKNGMGTINGKMIQIVHDPDKQLYLLYELREPGKTQKAA